MIDAALLRFFLRLRLWRLERQIITHFDAELSRQIDALRGVM